MTALFDALIIVDWSAANAPKRGKDSIWIAEARLTKARIRVGAPINPPTRTAAMQWLTARFARALSAGERVFAGFDFPFGYPAGAAARLAGAPRWDALWRAFAEAVDDGDDNRSNRFALAQRWNRDALGAAYFWGRPHQHRYRFVPAKKPDHDAFRAMEHRIVETWRPPAKSVWQLAYNGAVGSQAILGIARLEGLRAHFAEACAIWPFETAWASRLNAPIVLAEVYPSMITPQLRPGEVKDAGQVRTLARLFAAHDRAGRFRALLARPDGLSAPDHRRVMAEEGWMVGAGRSISAP